MEKVYQDDDEIEIDHRELLFEMKKKIRNIIAGLLIGAAITGAPSISRRQSVMCFPKRQP